MEHYPLFIGKVMECFGGRNEGVSSKKGEARKMTKSEACLTSVVEIFPENPLH